MGRLFLSMVLAVSLVCLPSMLCAEPISEKEAWELRKQLQEVKAALASLQKVVESQEAVINRLSAVTPAATPEAPQNLAVGAATSRTKQFNPDIGVVADFVGRFSESNEDEDGNDRLSARHVELVFGHAVDPYGRLDVTIAIADFEEAEIEEAYYSAWDLPLGLTARLGRFRAKVGYASPLHLDSLETVDEPLVVSRYLGAEGLFRTGAEFSGFLPLPWEAVTHELIGGVLEGGVGDDGTLLGSSSRTPTLYARLRNSADVTDSLGLDLGSTFMAGSADDDTSFEVRTVGVDLSSTYHFNPIQKLKVRGELYVQDRSAPFIDEEEVAEGESSDLDQRYHTSPFGAYILTDLRFAERWDVGARWDWVEPVNDREEYLRSEEQAWSIFSSFFQSEFARWRLQYQYRQPLEGGDDNTLFLQGTFAIGNHKHSIQ